MAPSPVDIVDTYLRRVWNAGELDLLDQVCADTVIRHEAGKVDRMDRARQRKRIAGLIATRAPQFTDVVLHGDDRFVTSVWNLVGDGGAWQLCGIEVFRIEDGRIAEVWNSAHLEGAWG